MTAVSTHDELSLEAAMSPSVVDWDALSDGVLGQGIFSKLPLFDLLRVRAVCKRWHDITAQALNSFKGSSHGETRSFCPLVFRRNSLQHLWCGYDNTAGAWELLPSLRKLPQVDIRPLAGNGKSLMGFKITTVPSQLVVGNPLTSEWQTIPKSTETWGEVGNVLLVDHGTTTSASAASFRIIAVRDDATEIFNSKLEVWAKLRQSLPPGLQEATVLCMRDKYISGTLCGNLLFCYGVDALVAFDVDAERWTEDHIRLPPHASSKCIQMLECGGALFAAIENMAEGTIAVWGLGLRRREFVRVGEMPSQLYAGLCKKAKGKGGKQAQLKAVGHKHRMYFWRNFGDYIVEFQQLRREWKALPQFNECLGNATGPDPDPTDAFQTFVDTGSFEP